MAPRHDNTPYDDPHIYSEIHPEKLIRLVPQPSLPPFWQQLQVNPNTLPRNFLQPIPKKAKKNRTAERLDSDDEEVPRKQESFCNLRKVDELEGLSMIPASRYSFVPWVGINSSPGSSRAVPSIVLKPPAPYPSCLDHAHLEWTGSPQPPSYENSTAAFSTDSTSHISTSRNALGKVRTAKKVFQFGSYVLVRADQSSPWKVANYVRTATHRDEYGHKYHLYHAETIFNFDTNETVEGTYLTNNIIQIPEDDSPHVPPQNQAMMRMRYLPWAITSNSFLFAAIGAPSTPSGSGYFEYRESWHPVMCLQGPLPNNGYSVRVVAGRLLGKEFVIYNVKPFYGYPSRPRL